MVRSMLWAVAAAGWLAAVSPALADCQLNLIAQFHVDPKASVPIANGEINGRPVKVLIDTGSSLTLFVTEKAKALGLPMHKRADATLHAIGGEVDSFETKIDLLKIGQLNAKNLTLLGVSAPDVAPDVAVILGDDILSQYDVEFAVTEGYVRLMQPKGCSPDQLVYWNKPFSQADLVAADRDLPAIMSTAVLNGRRQPVQIDSGADVTIVDQLAASEVGVRRHAGADNLHIGGLGPQDRAAWVGQFDSFALGDEQIGHPRLTVIKLAQDTVDNGGAYMVPRSIDGNTPPTILIGADFIRAHHLLIGTREHVIVFSYSGGPIFSVPTPPTAGPPAR